VGADHGRDSAWSLRARATAFQERFFGFAETALFPLPALARSHNR